MPELTRELYFDEDREPEPELCVCGEREVSWSLVKRPRLDPFEATEMPAETPTIGATYTAEEDLPGGICGSCIDELPARSRRLYLPVVIAKRLRV